MQETRNNCFGSKLRSTFLRQAKTGMHECRKVTATLCKCIIKLPVKNLVVIFKPIIDGLKITAKFLLQLQFLLNCN